MKKLIIVAASVLAASSVYAAPATVCSRLSAAGNGSAIDGSVGFTAAAGGSTGFVINSFTPKCSANVYAAVEQSEIALAVAAGSAKGKNLFGGSTNGGGVKPADQQFNQGVPEDTVKAGATAALAAGTSSN